MTESCSILLNDRIWYFILHCLAYNTLFGKLTASVHEIWPVLENIAVIRLCSADITQRCRISNMALFQKCMLFFLVQRNRTKEVTSGLSCHLIYQFASSSLWHQLFSCSCNPEFHRSDELRSWSRLCSIGLCFQIIHRKPG